MFSKACGTQRKRPERAGRRSVDEEHFAVFGEGPAVVVDEGFEGVGGLAEGGHGGEDGGAVSVTGKKESEINLEIGLRCEELAAFFGIETVMTRDSELIEYPAELSTTHSRKVWDQKSRVSLINSTENAVLVSIHQNYFTESRRTFQQSGLFKL